MKKILSAVMAGAMVASMAAVAVSAAGSYSLEPTDIVADGLNSDGDPLTSTTIKSGRKIYIPITTITDGTVDYSAAGLDEALADSDFASWKFKKSEGSKKIKSIKLVEKALDNYNGGNRAHFIEIDIVEDMTDADTKVVIETTITIKKEKDKNNTPNPLLTAGAGFSKKGGNLVSGDKLIFDTKFFVKNTKMEDEDNEFDAGTKGVVMKPVKNEENTVEWVNNNDTIAKLKYEADSDVVTVYPKLSTKWDNSLYAAEFAAGDAYIFDFVGNPSISSTARAKLSLYNPFINDDDDYTVAASDLYVYEVVDGELVDVTSKFTATEDEDDDAEVLMIKTRVLGTYIVSDVPAAGATTTPEPTDPVTPPTAPEPSKPNPGTGR